MSYVLCLIITTFTRLWQESLLNIKLFSIILTLIYTLEGDLKMGFNSGFGMYSFMDTLFPFIFFIVFFIIITVFILIFVQGIITWNKNNHSPLLTVPAKVVAKRNHTSHFHNTHDSMPHSSSSTSYYVTFEFESGDRLELHVASNEYGYLVEGDMGKLTFQGTRYKNFERTK